MDEIIYVMRQTIVEFSLVRASIGPDATASNIPYISIFAAKLCSMHLKNIYLTVMRKNE